MFHVFFFLLALLFILFFLFFLPAPRNQKKEEMNKNQKIVKTKQLEKSNRKKTKKKNIFKNKTKSKNQRKQEKEASKACLPKRLDFFCFEEMLKEIVQQLRPNKLKKQKQKPWTLKVALRPSGVVFCVACVVWCVVCVCFCVCTVAWCAQVKRMITGIGKVLLSTFHG